MINKKFFQKNLFININIKNYFLFFNYKYNIIKINNFNNFKIFYMLLKKLFIVFIYFIII